MSFTPAWSLMPYVVLCRTKRSLSTGFRTEKEAIDYIKKNKPEVFTLREN